MAAKTIILDSPYLKREKGKRTKSQRDLANQLYRIVRLSKDPDNDPRVERAMDIAGRYQENMMNTRRRYQDYASLRRAEMSGNSSAVDAARKRIVDRQYSKRQYMGLNNG